METDRSRNSPTFPPRRPPALGLSPVTVWVIGVYLRESGKKPDFRTWVSGLRPTSLFTEADRAAVLEETAQLEYVGRWYRASLASDLGNAEPAVSAPAAPLAHEISVGEAAEVLGVSERRIRQLCTDEVIEGRKDGWSWRVSRASVVTYREMRAA